MSAGIAGTLYLIVKIIDIFVYPTFGAFADRNETKWGKYRPFLLFSTPVLLFFIILLFSTPSLNGIGKTLYYFIIYLLFDLTYATISVSYQSLTAVMSKDSTQRNFVVMSRELFGMV
jgi:Na+/melibiose symporter-like transporter